MNDYLVQEFKLLILNGYYNSQTVHSEIFSDKEPNIPVIIGHLAIANSYINAAKAVYVCNNDELTRQEFDEFFIQFGEFSGEVMESIRTNHSPQWSDIEFRRLEEAYEPVASLLGVIR